MSSRWYFTKEDIENSPSRKCGIDVEKETQYRQVSAMLIRDIGSKLKVGYLVIDTAIVYMHRFYMRHSFTKCPKNIIAIASIFLSSKVEESPRKLEYVIKAAYSLIHRENLDQKSEVYQQWLSDLIFHENLLLRTLGFDLIIDHPQKLILSSLTQFNVTEEIIQANFYFASSMYLTSTFCLRFPPSMMACICIYLVKNWVNFRAPNEWWLNIDKNVTRDILKDTSNEYLKIFEKCPENLRILGMRQINRSNELVRANNPQNASTVPHARTDSNSVHSSQSSQHHNSRSDSRHMHNRDNQQQLNHKMGNHSVPHSRNHDIIKKPKLEIGSDELKRRPQSHVSSTSSSIGVPPSADTSLIKSSVSDSHVSKSRESVNNTSHAVAAAAASAAASKSILMNASLNQDTLKLKNKSDNSSVITDDAGLHRALASNITSSSNLDVQNRLPQPAAGAGGGAASLAAAAAAAASNIAMINELQKAAANANTKVEDGFKMEFSDNEDSNPITDNPLNSFSSLLNDASFAPMLPTINKQPPDYNSIAKNDKPLQPAQPLQQQKLKQQQQPTQALPPPSTTTTTDSSKLSASTSAMPPSGIPPHFPPPSRFSNDSLLGTNMAEIHSPAAIIRSKTNNPSLSTGAGHGSMFSHATPIGAVATTTMEATVAASSYSNSLLGTVMPDITQDSSSYHKSKKHKKEKKQKKEKKHKKHKHKDKDRDGATRHYHAELLDGSGDGKIKLKLRPPTEGAPAEPEPAPPSLKLRIKIKTTPNVSPSSSHSRKRKHPDEDSR